MYFVTAYWVLIFTASIASQQDEPNAVTYDGAQVWRTTLRDNSDYSLVQTLVVNEEISLWKLTMEHADFMVREDKKLTVHKHLQSRSLNHSVLIMDVQLRINQFPAESTSWTEESLRIGHRVDWKSYPKLSIIHEYLDFMKDNYPSIFSVRTIAYSVEKRPIKLVKISNGNPANRGILLLAGQHSREWIAITSGLYMIEYLTIIFDKLPGYGKNIDWYIVPVGNPDGYEYSQSHDRLWRKNRRKNNNCVGVDLNRNYAKDWGQGTSECSSDYAGSHPFSEPESVAIRDLILNTALKLVAFVDVHSYGQMILYPWSSTRDHTSHSDMHRNTALKMVQGVLASTSQVYHPGTTIELMYPVHGAGIDWCYSLGVFHSYAIEMRDTGGHGFLLPPEYIESAGKDLVALIFQMARMLSTKRALVEREGCHTWF